MAETDSCKQASDAQALQAETIEEELARLRAENEQLLDNICRLERAFTELYSNNDLQASAPATATETNHTALGTGGVSDNPSPPETPKKLIKVYVDIVGDMFHFGHMSFFKKARQFGNYLIVGVCPDAEVSAYKRKPILSHDERVKSVEGCKWVDEVIPNAPMAIDHAMIKAYGIDYVVHGDDFDIEKLKKYYSVPMELGIFRTVPYTDGVSTTELIRRCKESQHDKNS